MSDELEVLFVSGYCSDEHYKWICSIRTKNSLDPSQRMFKGMVEGMNACGCHVTCISAIPIGTSNTRCLEFKKEEETVNNTDFVYLGFRVGKFIRLFDLYQNTKVETKKWIQQTQGKKRIVICDSLIAMCAIQARKIAQEYGIKTYAYVSDYPSMATSIKQKVGKIRHLLQALFDKVSNNDLNKYDGYILVAENLKKLIKIRDKSFVVVEGIISVPPTVPRFKKEYHDDFKIIYAGALCERFGINKLIDAVLLTKNENISMVFYGSGESVDYIKEQGKKDSRIHYGGFLLHEDLLIEQQTADLLINPRPTDEVFSSYSFPSKTLSYMISGVPVLSTRISGIPNSYEPYLFWFNSEETVDMADTIDKVSRLTKEELQAKAKQAYEYVVAEKNGERQCQKILEFVQVK